MPHEDGAAYAPVVATVSLGGTVMLDLYTKEENSQDDGGYDGPKWRILQEPGSLLVTTGSAYDGLRHGIEPLVLDENLSAETVANWHLLGNKAAYECGTNERTTRISLTYRDVLKVVKVPIGVLGNRRLI